MTPILIDKNFEKAAEEYRSELRKYYPHPSYVFRKYFKFNGSNITSKHIECVKQIIRNWNAIIIARPIEMKHWISIFDTYKDLLNTKLVVAEKVEKTKTGKTKIKDGLPVTKPIKKTFRQIIIDEMGYTKARTILAPKLLALGIKTCFYCNAQYAVSSRNEAYYDFDHIEPKDKYPFLCVSFFNLIPACAVCNRHKSYRDGLLPPYVENPLQSPFTFHYTHSAGNLLDAELYTIHFKESDSKYKNLREDYDKRFRITNIYANHRDVAVEIEKKRTDFNESGLKALFATLGVHTNRDIVQRVLLGTYHEDNDVYRRPLSKFINDTSKDLIDRIQKFRP